MSEQISAAECASEASSAEQTNELAVQANGQASGPVRLQGDRRELLKNFLFSVEKKGKVKKSILQNRVVNMKFLATFIFIHFTFLSISS